MKIPILPAKSWGGGYVLEYNSRKGPDGWGDGIGYGSSCGSGTGSLLCVGLDSGDGFGIGCHLRFHESCIQGNGVGGDILVLR
jgi:hypothetical protein